MPRVSPQGCHANIVLVSLQVCNLRWCAKSVSGMASRMACEESGPKCVLQECLAKSVGPRKSYISFARVICQACHAKSGFPQGSCEVCFTNSVATNPHCSKSAYLSCQESLTRRVTPIVSCQERLTRMSDQTVA